jgi:DNA polymerase type B, organellar and viral
MITKVRGGIGLKDNHGGQIPRYIIALDTETQRIPVVGNETRKSHTLRLGVAMSVRIVDGQPVGKKILRFTDGLQFLEWMVEHTGPRHTVWVVGHNVLFDFKIAGFREAFKRAELVPDRPRGKRSKSDIAEQKPKYDGLFSANRQSCVLALRAVKTGGRIIVVDSLNWFACPLSHIAEQLDTSKLPIDFDDCTESELFDYCERDTEIVLDAFIGLVNWVRSNDLGVFRYTSASQAMSAFRHRMMPQRVYFHKLQPVKRLERAAFFGGRTEVFRMGEINDIVYKLDVSSLFPSVMEKHSFPYTVESYEMREEYQPHFPYPKFDDIVAEVAIDTDDAIYPCKVEHRTIYPTGPFRTVLCGPELAHALAAGRVRGVRSWARYKLENLFSDYVQKIWQMRIENERNGNKLYATLCKKLLVSLHGKFGQRPEEWVSCPDEKAVDVFSSWSRLNMRTMEYTEYRSVGYETQRKVSAVERFSTFCPIPAYTTAYARLRMNYLRAVAGRDNVYYQGIDSLIVSRAGLDRLDSAGEVHDRRLGYLRLEQSSNYGEIRGCGDYTLGSKHTVMGRSSTATMDEHGEFTQRQFEGVNSLFDFNINPDIVEVERKWKSSGQYSKGIVGQDGWVTPLTVSPDTKS